MTLSTCSSIVKAKNAQNKHIDLAENEYASACTSANTCSIKWSMQTNTITKCMSFQEVKQLNEQIQNFTPSAHFGVVGEPLCSSTVVFPSIPAHVSLWWIAAWASGRPAPGTKYWQVSRFPSPSLVKYFSPKLMNQNHRLSLGSKRFVIDGSLFGVNFKRQDMRLRAIKPLRIAYFPPFMVLVWWMASLSTHSSAQKGKHLILIYRNEKEWMEKLPHTVPNSQLLYDKRQIFNSQKYYTIVS